MGKYFEGSNYIGEGVDIEDGKLSSEDSELLTVSITKERYEKDRALGVGKIVPLKLYDEEHYTPVKIIKIVSKSDIVILTLKRIKNP